MPFYTPSKPTFELAGKQFPRVTWYKEPRLRRLYITLMFAVLTSATNGYDGSMMNGLQALKYWKISFNTPSSSTRGLLNAIMSVGSIVALPITPYIADLAGRRAGVTVGCIIMIIGVILQSIGATMGMFIAGRFLIGFGVAIAHGSAPLLISELVHPQHRAIFTTVYNSTWYLGSIIAAWLTYGTAGILNAWSWRIPCMAQAVPSCIQLCAIWLIPESPRFLISKGKNEKALQILTKYHAHGDDQSELVRAEYREIKETIRLELEVEGNPWLDFFRTPGNRRRLIILVALGFFSQWSGNGLVSYYMSDVLGKAGVTNPKTQLEINGILMIINFVTAVSACFLIDKIGRRPLFLLSTAGMCGTFVIWTICAAEFVKTAVPAAGYAEIVFIFVYYVFYNCAWSGLLVGYAVEILPFRLRAKGLTLMFFCVDASLFFNSYVNPIALDKMNWKYYIVYDVWLAFELLIVYFFWVETRNTPLEEIVKLFDGDEALLGGHLATGKAKKLLVEEGGGDETLHTPPVVVGDEKTRDTTPPAVGDERLSEASVPTEPVQAKEL